MKTKSFIWVSICCCLAAAGVGASAADDPSAASLAIKTKSSTIQGAKAEDGKPGSAVPSTNSVTAQAAPPPQVSSVHITRLTQSKPQSLKNKKYGGPIYAAFTSKDAYQLINPFAPSRYGHAEDNMPVDPSTGKPAGVTLFAIHRLGAE
jgi:hypothetical protein